jgi:hypothetical protein
LEALETAIRARILWKSDYRTMFNNPSGNAFTNFKPNIAKIALVRHLGGAQHDLVCLSFNQVNETRVTLCNLGCKTHNFPQHFIDG